MHAVFWLVHLVATLTGYVDILLNRIVFLESIVRCLQYSKYEVTKQY